MWKGVTVKPAGDAGRRRTNVLGVGISPVSMKECLETIEAWIERDERSYVCLAALHSVLECRRDPGLRRIFNSSGLTTPDGMPLVWLSRLAGNPQAERVYGADLMQAACGLSRSRGYTHYFYGADPGVASSLAQRLSAQFPGLSIVGTYSPPRGPEDAQREAREVEAINASRADMVWVGLGTGKQERWMAVHRPHLDAPVLIGVGAAFDFLAGSKRQAPRWMRGAGLEWCFRLLQEPRRLWPRYREYPRFVWLLFGQVLGWKDYPLDGNPSSEEDR